jgi:hypothetical protein
LEALREKFSRFLHPPVDTDGEWVLRAKFHGKKSFGFFLCHQCQKPWISAHAQPKYRQACKKCQTSVTNGEFPLLLWQNAERRESRSTTETSPHEASLCEACLRGDCR